MACDVYRLVYRYRQYLYKSLPIMALGSLLAVMKITNGLDNRLVHKYRQYLSNILPGMTPGS